MVDVKVVSKLILRDIFQNQIEVIENSTICKQMFLKDVLVSVVIRW